MKRPPVAARREHTYTHHGITVSDPYHWLKDSNYPEVTDPEILSYLEEENQYYKSVMDPLADGVQTLFAEIKARQKPDESSVPLRDGAYFYQTRYVANAEYPRYVRWPASEGPDNAHPLGLEILLDTAALANGHDFFRLGGFSVSHDGRFLAYSTDTNGSERYTLVIKDLTTGDLLANFSRTDTIYSPVWSASDDVLFYLVANAQWRPYQIRRHVIDTSALSESTTDDIIFEETDPGFFVSIDETTSREYLVISSADHVTSEIRVLGSREPYGVPRLIAARKHGHEYDVDHQGDRFVIRTNDTHKNFRVAVAPVESPKREHWTTFIDGSDDNFIRSVLCFKSFMAVAERRRGLDQIRVINLDGQSRYIDFQQSVYSCHIGANAEYDTTELRIGFSSLTTPDTTFDYQLDTHLLETRKVRELPSGYTEAHYASQRLFATARDGEQVPVSLVYHIDTPLDGSAPIYLYAYGAYGAAMSPSFSASRLSLLDRGFVYAIAHVRGGNEMGYRWYEAGKLMNRLNTFNDFVDVANFLIHSRYTSPGRIVISGGSAGGQLMGAAVNQAPEIFGAVIAHVPFVDALNTMLDASLPLTPIEWPEWGNPTEDKDVFEFIQSYSPYDNLGRGTYPAMMVTAGLHDPRVTYWEPAKYVAKLRTLKDDENPLILKTEMEAGHGGRSGRYDSLFEIAEEYAFLMDALNISVSPEASLERLVVPSPD